MLSRGFGATTVDQVCAEAGVTKGSFFHHFASKGQFGKAVLGHYWTGTQQLLSSARLDELDDPLERVERYLDLFVWVARAPEVEKSCLFGNLAQEVASSNAELRAACAHGFGRWAAQIATDLDEAKRAHGPRADFDSLSLAEHFIAVYEGSLVLAKAKGDASVLEASVEHFRAYLRALFGPTERGTGRARPHQQKEKTDG